MYLFIFMQFHCQQRGKCTASMRHNCAGFAMYLSFTLIEAGEGREPGKCKKQKALHRNKWFHKHYITNIY